MTDRTYIAIDLKSFYASVILYIAVSCNRSYARYIIILPYTTVLFEYHALGAIIYMKTTEILTSINAFMVAIKSMVGRSGRQRVQQDVLENLELVLPDYETQVRVGKVLSAVDDKIELNTQISHNLEGIAA